MLKHYRAMVALSRQMLEAARLADWGQLVGLGEQRDEIQAQLQTGQQAGVVPDLDASQETELVAALLAANDQIQRLVEDHLATLPHGSGPAQP
jgi:hypothetical protein